MVAHTVSARFTHIALLAAVCGLVAPGVLAAGNPAAVAHGSVDSGALFGKYCTSCHNTTDWAGQINLEGESVATLAETPDVGEKLIKRLRAGMMPPAG